MYAICGDHGCPNILVRSNLLPSLDREPYTPESLGWVTLHELGHAFGLGHTTSLLESTDLMGYSWPDLGTPVLSDCDLDALAFVFAWAFEQSDPHPPAEGSYDCSLDQLVGKSERLQTGLGMNQARSFIIRGYLIGMNPNKTAK